MVPVEGSCRLRASDSALGTRTHKGTAMEIEKKKLKSLTGTAKFFVGGGDTSYLVCNASAGRLKEARNGYPRIDARANLTSVRSLGTCLAIRPGMEQDDQLRWLSEHRILICIINL